MRIAVIGGIGSGKSEVISILRRHGVFCLSADEINAKLLENPNYIEKIKNEFPSAVKDGRVDRAELASIVFCDKRELEKLNAIAHPEITREIMACEVSPLVVEMPLIFECGAENAFDCTVLVKTPLRIRLIRLKKRGMTTAAALKRIKSQVSGRKLQSIATQIIKNNKDKEHLKREVLTAFRDVLEV